MVKKFFLACALAGMMLLAVMVMMAWADGLIVDLDNSDEDFRVIGISALDYLGEVAGGDINGDGIADLVIGASGTDLVAPERANAGTTYVIWGASDGLSGTLDLDSSPADFTVYSRGANFYLGRFVASGDINGDGIDDLIIGADAASEDSHTYNGAVYVLFGSPSLSGTVDLYTDTADLEIYGAEDFDRLGRSIATCDVNGDTVPDLIMGAYRDNTPGGTDAGAVYVIFGFTDLSGTIELDSDGADFTILGDDAYDRLGRSVACGDVDGDGTADIIAGGYRADQTWGNDAGEVYVVYGGTTLSGTLDLDSESPDALLRGVAGGDEAGFYVASGDINGDNTDDVLIGAYVADVNWPDSDTGTAYVVYGSDSLASTSNLSETADITIYGAAEGDRLSRSLSSGDFNGDGYADILIGASRADPATGRDDAGISYVIYGAPEITSTIYLSDTNLVAIQVLGDDEGDEAGRASGSGDLDGDGADDLIIGAVLALGTDSGETYIVHGSKAITLTLNPASETIIAGQTMTYTATASNKFGDWDITSKTAFTIAPAAGGTWSDNEYTSEKAETWIVTGTFQSLVATATLTVNPGALDHIVICTNANGQNPAGDHAMTTDDIWTLYAAGYDAEDNFIANQSVTWGSTGTLDAVNGSGTSYTFAPSTATTSGTITADDGIHSDATGAITVNPGALNHIAICTDANGQNPAGDHAMTTDDTWSLYAAGYDAEDNFIANQSVTWGSTGTLDAVNGSGTSYTFAPSTATTSGTITADDGSHSDATGTITVNPGALDHIVICTDANGQNPAGDHAMTTDDTWTLYAAGYDASGNYIDNVEATWSVTGDAIGTVDPTIGLSTTLDATAAGTGRVRADHVTAGYDETGDIAVSAGAPGDTYVYLPLVARGK